MIAGNILGKTRTLPLAVYSAVAAGDFDTAGKYVIVIVLLSFLGSGSPELLCAPGKTKQKGEKVMSLQVDIKKNWKDFSLDVRFDLDKGPLGILGASGCGKSMTLKCIAGILAA